MIGILLAVAVAVALALRRWAATSRRTLTALSIVPDLVVSAAPPTRAVLMATHLVAMAIVVPSLAGRLPRRTC